MNSTATKWCKSKTQSQAQGVNCFVPESCHNLLDVVSGVECSTKCDLEDSKFRAMTILDLVFVLHVLIAGMALLDRSSNPVSQPIDLPRKRKSRSRSDGPKNVAETNAKWKEYNNKLNSHNDESKVACKSPVKGSKKGYMKGKGGPENARYNYRGVRQCY